MMIQAKYIPLVCVLLGRMAKLHKQEIEATHHEFNLGAYCPLCEATALECKKAGMSVICPARPRYL